MISNPIITAMLVCGVSLAALFGNYANMHERGYNRGEYIDSCNRRAGVPLGSPYCASCAALTLDKGRIKYATKKRASARAYITDTSIDARKVWLGKIKIPLPCLAIWIRKGGGHLGLVTEINGDVMKCFEFNTSPDSKGSQWNGAWSGWKQRSIARDCAPMNAYRITHFQRLAQ